MALNTPTPNPNPPPPPPAPPTGGTGEVGQSPATDPAADGRAPADVHGRVRAYGSLAAEVADAGVAGVVAMRYNV